MFLVMFAGGTYENMANKNDVFDDGSYGLYRLVSIVRSNILWFFLCYRIEVQLKVEQDALLVGGICLF